MKMIFQIFTLIFLPCYLYGQDEYGKVYNEGLSKMEMIEKMDKYLSRDLPEQLKKLNTELERQELQFKSENSKINELLQSISARIDKIEENQTTVTKNESGAVSEDIFLYIKDLKNVIIPAIQKKLLDNESQMLNFIKQMTAKLDTEKLIENEIGVKPKEEELNE